MKTENNPGHENKTLKLTIDNKKYDWSLQYITGEEVKKLANIPEEDDLFLAIQKPWEDEPISNDTKVDLARPGIEKFFSVKYIDLPVTIIVNGKEKSWNKNEISFEEVVKLAFDNFVDNSSTLYTVTYKRGPEQNPEGTMVRGDKVFVKSKMIFNATPTDKS